MENIATAYNEILNPEQLAAVEYNDGVSVIVAGAGSGKTRVLTYKIAYLLENGWHPASILALTFTNKAAREMKNRIASVVGDNRAKWLWMGTFHSIFCRILRTEAEKIGFTNQFSIYDTADSKALVKSLIKELGLDDKKYKPNIILSRISNAKNRLITPAAYEQNNENYKNDLYANIPRFIDIFRLYCQRCKAANAMDFDDLLLNTFLLFKNCPDVLENYQNRFAYILVDEYQDTNIAQHIIVNQLAEKNGRICIVGDDAQSIYSFRGANINNMLSFEKTHQNCRMFRLERNYRSTQTIVNAANSLIAKNKNRIRKDVYSKLDVGEKIKVSGTFSDSDEAALVARQIRKLTEKEHVGYEEIAVLYRTNAQSRILEEELRKNRLPYRIYGSVSFYQRKEVKDVLAYLRLLVNPYDEESFKRIINFPARGIGDTTQKKLLDTAHLENVPLLKIAMKPQDFNVGVNKGTAAKLVAFAEMIRNFALFAKENDAYAVVEKVVAESGIKKEVENDLLLHDSSRKENVDELLRAIHDFCEKQVNDGSDAISLHDFLSEVALQTDQDTNTDDSAERITLMTVHAAKGLEFNHVFVVGMEENLFPSFMCITDNDVEEERRLFYVALTRAAISCHVSYAKSRFLNGQTQFCRPSRFLDDIDEEFLDFPEKKPAKKAIFEEHFPFLSHKNENEPQPRNLKPVWAATQSSSSEPANTFGVAIGAKVKHQTFGFGKVIGLEGEGNNTKALIEFENFGTKNLLLKYAKLEII